MGFNMSLKSKNINKNKIKESMVVVESEEGNEEFADVREELEEILFEEASRVNVATKGIILSIFQRVEKSFNSIKQDNVRLQTKNECLEEEIVSLKECIRAQEVKENLPSIMSQVNLPLPVTYAGLVRNKVHVSEKKNEFKLIIKPTDEKECADSENVKRTLIKELDSEKDNLKIRGIKKLKNKAVVLELENGIDLDIVKRKLEDGAKLSTTVPGRIKPRIIVYDVQKSLSDKDFIENMVMKNLKELSTMEEISKEAKTLFEMKATGKYKDNNRNNLVISISGGIYKQLK